MTTISVDIDDVTLARLQQLAAMCNVTVSEMAQRLLQVKGAPPLKHEDLPPITRSLSGIAPPMTDEEVERLLDEERMRKYGQ